MLLCIIFAELVTWEFPGKERVSADQNEVTVSCNMVLFVSSDAGWTIDLSLCKSSASVKGVPPPDFVRTVILQIFERQYHIQAFHLFFKKKGVSLERNLCNSQTNTKHSYLLRLLGHVDF